MANPGAKPSTAEEKKKQPTLKVRVINGHGGVLEEIDLLEEKVITEKDFWVTSSGNKVLSYDAFKKIAAKYLIVMKSSPDVLASPSESNNQQHWIGAWFGYANDKETNPGLSAGWRYAEGEASKLNTGEVLSGIGPTKGNVYMERGKVDAEYRGAMAFKRMYIRGIQSFLVFPDGKLFCEVETSSFNQALPTPEAGKAVDYKKV